MATFVPAAGASSAEQFEIRCWAAGDALLNGRHPVVPVGMDIPKVIKAVSGVVNYDTLATDPEGGMFKVWGERLPGGCVRLHIK